MSILGTEERSVLPIFIASPGDLGEERKKFRGVIEEVNRIKANPMGIQLEAIGWEDTLPGKGRPQSLINSGIKRCHLFVLLLWKRWGSPTGAYSSGTKEEFELAQSLSESSDSHRPEIWLYFKSVLQNMLDDPGEQLRQVNEFRNEIMAKQSHYYWEFDTAENGEKLFREHLCKWLDKNQPPKDSRTPAEMDGQVQIGHLVSCVSTQVIQTGIAEVMGEINLVNYDLPSGSHVTVAASMIEVLCGNVPIVNTFSGSIRAAKTSNKTAIIQDNGGITIGLTGGYASDQVTGHVANNPLGGQITISIPAGLSITAGDLISINGVRAAVVGIPVGGSVNVSARAEPSDSHYFSKSHFSIAQTNQGIVVEVKGVTVPLPLSQIFVTPTIRISEGFPSAFVQNTSVNGHMSINGRSGFGSNASTQIHVIVGNLPSGVTIDWPHEVLSNHAKGSLILSKHLCAPFDEAFYEFSTIDQAASDLIIETFDIRPTLTVIPTSQLGQGIVWVQLYPASTSFDLPRYNDPFQPNPAANFIEVIKAD